MLPEREDREIGITVFRNDVNNMDNITLENVTAKWNTNENEDTLKNINLNVKYGQLIAIAGPVGSGKVGFYAKIIDLILLNHDF